MTQAPLLPLLQVGPQAPQEIVNGINIGFYTHAAPSFDAVTKQHQLDTALQVFVDLIPKGVFGYVYDLGSGDGRNTAGLFTSLPAQYTEIIGIDNTPAMVQVAKKSYPQIRFECEDMTKEPFFYDSQIKGVLASTVLDNATDTSLEYMMESIGVGMRSGGIFYANYHRGSREGISLVSKYGNGESVARYRIEHEQSRVEGLLEANGFEILSGSEIAMYVPEDKRNAKTIQKISGAYDKVKGNFLEQKASVFARKL